MMLSIENSLQKQIYMHDKTIEHFEGEGESNDVLIIPLVHLKSLVIP